jgi:hypothetical protein
LGWLRDRLIERELVLKQLAYLLVTMRQKLLALPSKLSARFGPQAFTREMFELATLFIAEALGEVAGLPIKGTDPDWLERLEED